MNKGHISREHTVCCGICEEWERVSCHTLSYMKDMIKKSGWEKHKEHGWICHKCVKGLGDKIDV